MPRLSTLSSLSVTYSYKSGKSQETSQALTRWAEQIREPSSFDKKGKATLYNDVSGCGSRMAIPKGLAPAFGRSSSHRRNANPLNLSFAARYRTGLPVNSWNCPCGRRPSTRGGWLSGRRYSDSFPGSRQDSRRLCVRAPRPAHR